MTMLESSFTGTDIQSKAANGAASEILLADIGGSHIRLGRLRQGQDCELIATLPTPTQDWTLFSTVLIEAARPFMSSASALSISIAGLLAPETGQVTAANIPCLASRPLAQDLQSLLGLPVVVTNDADCAALAEARVGAGRGHEVVFCAILGTGVGGGLVVKQRLVRGAGGLTGEWGHGPVVNEAPVQTSDGRSVPLPRFACGCGLSGCVDTVGGARGLERLHSFLHQTRRTSRQILEAWLDAEPAAVATVGVYVERVSGPLALVVNVTGASVVPVCGGLSRCPDLITILDLAVRKQILRKSDQALLVPSQLNDQAGLIGAAYAAEAFFQ